MGIEDYKQCPTSESRPNLGVRIGKITLKTPVLVCSGTYGYGEEYSKLIDISQLGAIVVKGITLRPKSGNPPPRIVEVPAGVLVTVGMQNVGIETLTKEKLPFLRSFNVPLIVGLAGESVNEFVEMASILNRMDGVAGLELNVSCPNVKKGGMLFGCDPEMTYEVVKKVRKATDLTIITKLTPNVTHIATIAKSAEEAGTDAISLINAPVGLAIDVKTRKPKLGTNITGGLCGPAIRPIAVRMLWECHKVVKVPLIGMGGIACTEDALEFIIAGATAIAVGSANFVNPKAPLEIIKGIEKYMIENNIKDLGELIGTMRT
jgi:dihydroorotate dehydrogenase (NAD+) catalytic subunit